MLRGNIGEWSEIYVLLKLLADGKVYAADEELTKIKDTYFPVLKAIREETNGESIEYHTWNIVKIFHNGQEVGCIPDSIFEKESQSLLDNLQNKSNRGAFSIEKTEKFMNSIQCFKVKAPSINKSDIMLNVIDINTGYKPTVGFSIKSDLGSPPTLLNASKSTNFIYKVIHQNDNIIRETNDIFKIINNKKRKDIRGRISNIFDNMGTLEYHGMQNKTFKSNLILLDSKMDEILAQSLIYYYRDGINSCIDMIKKLEETNLMKYGNVNAYSYKFKKFLTAVALGMRPATEWDGIDEASGGYIVVTREGEVLAYHIYNRNYFEEYLLRNTKYDTASTSKHDFAKIYEENGDTLIKLNLQIRFK